MADIVRILALLGIAVVVISGLLGVIAGLGAFIAVKLFL